jgi:uncharacterized protein YozE (UPF0346 family)
MYFSFWKINIQKIAKFKYLSIVLSDYNFRKIVRRFINLIYVPEKFVKSNFDMLKCYVEKDLRYCSMMSLFIEYFEHT